MEVAACANVDLTKFLALSESKAKVKWKCAEYSVKMLEEGTHADITFEVIKGGSVKAHRSVLSTVSPVFAAMFQHDMKEKRTSIVQISDMTIDALKLLLLLLYTTRGYGIPELDVAVDKHFEELHYAITKYQVESILGSLYTTALRRNLTPDTCWIYLQRPDILSTHFGIICNYILVYYDEAINSDELPRAMKEIPDKVCIVVRQAYRKGEERFSAAISQPKRLRMD